MNEPIGYKRPPAATRWKKGQSGNPGGRTKGQLNLITDLIAELSEGILINEGGTPRRISKQRALLKALTARGIQGDSRAANLMINLITRLLETGQTAQPLELSREDQAIFETYIAKTLNQKGKKNDAEE